MIRKSTLAVSLAALLAVLTAVAAGAAVPGKYKITHFRVEVKGIQKTVQTFHHKPDDECDNTDNSSITEKVVFQSTPKMMTFYDAPGEVNPSVLFDKPGKWPAKATVTRHYTPRIITAPPSPKCGENDGNGETVVPLDDCGTKRVPDYELELEFDKRKKGGLRVYGEEHEDPFTNCLAPLGDLGFPFLILEDTAEKPILADMPADELFDPGIGKIIGLASGVQRYEEPSVSAKVSIEWDVSLTRVGGVKTS